MILESQPSEQIFWREKEKFMNPYLHHGPSIPREGWPSATTWWKEPQAHKRFSTNLRKIPRNSTLSLFKFWDWIAWREVPMSETSWQPFERDSRYPEALAISELYAQTTSLSWASVSALIIELSNIPATKKYLTNDNYPKRQAISMKMGDDEHVRYEEKYDIHHLRDPLYLRLRKSQCKINN